MSIVLETLRAAQTHGISLYSINNELKFQAPKGSMTGEIKNQILDQKSALIALLTALQITAPHQLDAFGLSYEQKRLWFTDKLSPELASFNMPDTMWLEGELQQNAFEKAVNKVIERHWVLRTNVVECEGEALARLQLTWQNPVVFHDVSALSGAEQQAEILAIEQQALLQPFDLANDVLLRWTVVKVSTTTHKLFFDMHHIASDAGSMDLLFNEVLVAYDAYLVDPNAQCEQLTPLTAQYKDYAQWQRTRTETGALDTDKQFWCEQLQDIPVTHQFPMDSPRPAVWTGKGEQQDVMLNKADAEALYRVAAEQNVTPFMLFFSAYAFLLSKHAQSPDVIVGTPITGRAEQRFEPLIGFFVNNLVLRTQVDASLTYADFLQVVRKDLFEAFAHQTMPFDLLVETLNPERSTAHEALFQLNFYLYDRRGLQQSQTGSLQIKTAGEHKVQLKNDIELSVSLHDERIHLELLYAADLFDSERMQRFSAQLGELLQQLPALIDTPIAQINPLTEQERHYLLAQWQPPAEFLEQSLTRAKQAEQRFDQRFARIVAEFPEAVAVVDEAQQLSFSVLAQRANQLSHHLLQEGVAVGDVVAIALPRGVDWAIAVVAIAQIGASYLPIDLQYPAERIQYLLDDAQCQIAIAAPDALASETLTYVDIGSWQWTSANVSAPHVEFSTAQCLYVIYTSGSTGQPKGVQNTHRSVSSYFDAVQQVYAVTAADNVMQFSSVSFDIFVEELCLTLLTGATLVCRNEACLSGDQAFWALVQQQQVSVLSLPTSFFHVLAEQASQLTMELPDCLRLVIYGGEAVSTTLLAKWQQFVNNQAVGNTVQSLNTYGPTEASVVATYLDTTAFDCEAALQKQQSVPIGKPFADTRVYILDAQQQLLPQGVWGELCLSGGSIANGYLGKPTQTDAVFIPDPHSTLGLTLYRTGDVARINTQGDIEFGGRRDSQVKFRGYRIELEEIARKIELIDSCAEAVVMIQHCEQADQDILAVFVKPFAMTQLADDGAWLAQVQTAAAELLPAYMLPSHYVPVVEFPLTTNGKIDKAALLNIAQPNALAFARMLTQLHYQQLISGEGLAQLVRTTTDITQASLRDIAQRLSQIENDCGLVDQISDIDSAVTNLAATIDHAESANGEGDSQFWRDYFAELAVSWYLPSATASIDQPAELATFTEPLPSALFSQLHTLAASLEVDAASLLAGAFMWLLHRHSGNADIAINCGIALRSESTANSENAVGGPSKQHIDNTQSMTVRRAAIDPEQGLHTWLTQLFQQACQLQGRHAPNSLQLEQWLERASTLGNCLPCALQYSEEYAVDGSASVSTFSARKKPSDPIASQWRLVANCSSTAIQWQYDTQLWCAEYIQRLHGQLVQGLQALVAAGDKLAAMNLWQWDVLPYAEKALLHRFNTQSMQANEPLQHGNVHERILAQITKTPHKLAVALGNERLTYQQLGEQSETLAATLQQQGVALGDRVGVCLDRGGRFMVSIVAIMRVGGCYVPIDTSYPAERQRFIQQDSQLQALIVDEFSAESIPADLPIPVISLSDANAHSDHRVNCRPVEVPAHAELYVIYTSGSTGTPKGAAITHANELNLLDWYCPFYHITEADNVLVASAVGFDLTQKNLLSAMVTGASVFFATAKNYDPDAIVATIEQEHIHWTNFSPSLLYPLIKNPENWPRLRSLRWVMLGGEPINMSRLNDWLATYPAGFKLINQYGPTEATDVACCYTIPLPHVGASPAIGRPNANVCLYVLDKQQQPVPVGGIGELFIGGFGVSKGYIGRPELNAQTFVANPWRAGERMYKTGDLVRYREDGVLDFLGRLDHQVNIRSLRIELGEIMTRLKQMPSVADVLITVHQPDDEPNLLAYVVVAEDQQSVLNTPATTEQFVQACRQHLAAELPNYMVPNLWQVLAQFPLTPNGKIDRKKLPQPNEQPLRYQLPENAIESQLQGQWCEILDRPAHKVGVTDLLFSLGGHSLTATRIAARINQQWQVELTPADVIANATIRQLAELIVARSGRSASDLSSSNQVRINTQIPAMGEQQGPLSFSQQRLWFIDQLQGGTGEYVMVAGFNVTGTFNPQAAQAALQAIVDRHQILRTVYLEQGDELRQQVLQHAPVILHQQSLMAITEAEQQTHIDAALTLEGSTPFNLTADLMLRARWLQTSDTSGVLVIAQHHIASDGWSMGVLAQEFLRGYAQYLSEQHIHLKPLPIQYLDFALWQQQQKGSLTSALKYWEQALTDLPVVHRLPMDAPHHAARSRRAQRVNADIPQALADQVNAIAQAHQLTPFMLLHGAYALLLSRMSDSQDIVIGSPVANRHWPELEPLIGFFVNTLVLRIQLQPDDTIASYFQRVRQANLNAQANQQVPFEQLVDTLNVPRSAAHSPIFQCLLAMDSTPSESASDVESSLHFEPLASANDIAKFDITLSIGWADTTHNLCWEYDSSLFHDSRIQQFNHSFIALLQQLVTQDTATPLNEISLLSAAQQRWFSERAIAQDEISLQAESLVQRHRIDDTLLMQAAIAQTSATAGVLFTEHSPLGMHYQGVLCVPESIAALAVDDPMVIDIKNRLKTSLQSQFASEFLPQDWGFVSQLPQVLHRLKTMPLKTMPLKTMPRIQAPDTQSRTDTERQLQKVLQQLFTGNAQTIALDQPFRELPLQAAQLQQPLQNDTQVQIGQFFAELTATPLQSLSPQSQFFAIGGHSLLVVQLLNRINQHFHVAVPLVRVFDDPSIEAIAAFIDLANAQQHAATAIAENVEDDSLEEMEW